MTDLVIHIGLHKTGTTSLQRFVFDHHPGYLGTRYDRERADDFGRVLYDLLAIGNTGEAVQQCRQHMLDGEEKGLGTLVISQERLVRRAAPTGRIRWGLLHEGSIKHLDNELNRPILPILQMLREGVRDIGKLKVLFTHRNQPEWLASHYAQYSRFNSRASQSDFEAKVKRIIDSGNDYMSWSKWIAELEAIVDKENLCTLPVEKMVEQVYWEILSDFLGSSEPLKPVLDKRKNVRRRDANSWTLSPFDAERTWKRELKEYYKHEKGIEPPYLVRKSALIAGKMRKVLDQKSQKTIEINDEHHKKITNHINRIY